ncbi:TPM domain-containing protein [Parasediminibacterium paludis]|uniref:TPM domain-containing protein n=1 Tax=Parasediminibacterium paludis TaxID=908966 RepID=A0ABV8PSF4_9BACT
MIKKILLFILVVIAVFNTSAQKFIPKPVPQRLVVDNANILSSTEQETLERKLIALDDSTSNQIAILTVKSLNGESIEDVANATFREWGIGNKKTKNGILVLVAIEDRKIRIEVGYGLEGAIPDITANDIIDNDIKPNFKLGNYFDGLNTAVDNLSKAAAGEYHVAREKKAIKGNGGGGTILGIILIVIIIIVLSSRGGGSGGRGGDFITPFIIGSMLGGVRGGGGGWSDGGGDSGGGFGGFGGGDSGGGGASGSW